MKRNIDQSRQTDRNATITMPRNSCCGVLFTNLHSNRRSQPAGPTYHPRSSRPQQKVGPIFTHVTAYPNPWVKLETTEKKEERHYHFNRLVESKQISPPPEYIFLNQCVKGRKKNKEEKIKTAKIKNCQDD